MSLPTVEGGYGTIVADPPWPYDTRVKGTRALPAQMVADGSRLMRPVTDWTYDPMALDEIAALGVKAVASKNAHLYLWCTNSFIEQAHTIARAWGFKPSTVLTWVKVRKDEPGIASMKTGYWYRGATEHVLFATRGSCSKPTVALPTAFIHPRIGEHSRKPEAFYLQYVERISPAPRLELFARGDRPGWTSWGDQA